MLGHKLVILVIIPHSFGMRSVLPSILVYNWFWYEFRPKPPSVICCSGRVCARMVLVLDPHKFVIPFRPVALFAQIPVVLCATSFAPLFHHFIPCSSENCMFSS